MGLGNATTCVYKFIFSENGSNDTKIIQYFIMNGLVLCIKLDNFVAHMFYAWSFSYNTSVTISIYHNTFFLSFNTYPTVFDWGTGHLNKI